jgi:hypothetical protein
MARTAWVAALGFFVCTGMAFACAGHPAFLPLDPPVGLVQGDPGRTTFTLSVDGSGWEAVLARSLATWCDIAATIGSAGGLDLGARVRVPWVPYPLRAELDVGTHALTALGALSLGPYRLTAARTWGRAEGCRIAAAASSPRVIAAAGVESGSRPGPFLAATWCPDVAPLWTVTLAVLPSGVRVTVGGTW